jgi:periplasmic protein TonB
MEDKELSRATLDDIVFENRNKSYGAFFLRKLYDKNVLTALGISVSVFSLALASPSIAKLFSKEEIAIVDEKVVDVKIIDVPIDPKIKPLPIIKLDPPQIKTLKFIPPEPAPDKDVTEPPPPPQVKLDDTKVSDQDREGDDSNLDIPDVPIGDPNGLIDDGESLWNGSVEKEAQFAGGRLAMMKYINSRLSSRLRDYITDREIKGRLWVGITIDKNGKVKDVDIPPGKEMVNCKLCNEEIVKIIADMPGWTAAENNGIPVNRKILIPIVF